MKGLELSERYYEAFGKPMIQKQFSDYEQRIAVGLVGDGSECLGYDDALSQDHDFGPGFCLWLTREDFAAIGGELTKAYENLPKDFLGYQRNTTAQAAGRVGVMNTEEFYSRYVGDLEDFSSPLHWLRIPEHLLCCAVNGRVFTDPLGDFSRIRAFLSGYYPEDVRLKKIAARLALMAQSGQYNFYRTRKRKEFVAARQALDIFVRETLSLIGLLNRTYMPYYKWVFRKAQELPILHAALPLIEIISVSNVRMSCGSAKQPFVSMKEAAGIGSAMEKDIDIGDAVEEICREAVKALREQGLVSRDYDFLEPCAREVMQHIETPEIRALHIMTG